MCQLKRGIARKSACFLVLALAIGIAANSSAAIIGTASQVRNPPTIPFAAPDAALGAPWVGYAVGLQSTAGEIIAAVDVSITGPLHQRWVYDEDSGNFTPTVNSANLSNGDSHLRMPAGGLLGFVPVEDNPGTGSPLSDTVTADYGVGSFLKGAWGIAGAAQTASANLAYLVVPQGRENELTIRVLVADPLGNIIARLREPDFFPDAYAPPVVGDLEIRQPPNFSQPVIVTLPASDDRPLDELTWSLESFTPSLPAFPPVLSPTVDSQTGQFRWFSAGAGSKTYTAVIRATDVNGLSDTGILTIVPLPEPSAFVLLGCALVGVAFPSRRRKQLCFQSPSNN